MKFKSLFYSSPIGFILQLYYGFKRTSDIASNIVHPDLLK